MIPNNWWNIQNLKETERIPTLTRMLKDFYNILNKGIVPVDNFRGAYLTCVFTATDTNTAFKHGLSFVPQNYFVVGTSVAMSIYDGNSNDSSFVNLKSTVAGTARIFVF